MDRYQQHEIPQVAVTVTQYGQHRVACGCRRRHSLAPAIAPAILANGNGSYGVLYTVAGISAIIGAVAILPVKRAR